MGLLDVLNGMQAGPRGQRRPGSGRGMSPITMALLGPNQEIAPGSLANAAGADTLDALAKQTGMQRDDLLAGLGRYLPGFVDHMTPNGRVPTEEEAERMV
jgi:uncharacterized protein YidB (DUF937 family)